MPKEWGLRPVNLNYVCKELLEDYPFTAWKMELLSFVTMSPDLQTNFLPCGKHISQHKVILRIIVECFWVYYLSQIYLLMVYWWLMVSYCRSLWTLYKDLYVWLVGWVTNLTASCVALCTKEYRKLKARRICQTKTANVVSSCTSIVVLETKGRACYLLTCWTLSMYLGNSQFMYC